MRTISILLVVIATSVLALTQVKTRDANQKTQDAREITSMRKQAKATFGIKFWDEKAYNEVEGPPKLTRVTATKSY